MLITNTTYRILSCHSKCGIDYNFTKSSPGQIWLCISGQVRLWPGLKNWNLVHAYTQRTLAVCVKSSSWSFDSCWLDFLWHPEIVCHSCFVISNQLCWFMFHGRYSSHLHRPVVSSFDWMSTETVFMFHWSCCVSLHTILIGVYLPYILAYKPTIFGPFLTFKLWGSAYTWVMPHSQSRQSAWRLSVSDAHCVCVCRSRRGPLVVTRAKCVRGGWPRTHLCCCCCSNLTPFQHSDRARPSFSDHEIKDNDDSTHQISPIILTHITDYKGGHVYDDCAELLN